jgi:hypothetical protein
MNPLSIISEGNIIEFSNANWRGEKGYRKVRVVSLAWGSTEYHPEDQWLLVGFDLDKQAERIFAMKDMEHVRLV